MNALAIPDRIEVLGTCPADLIDSSVDYEPATAEAARERADLIRSGLPTWADVVEALATARAHQDWRALGYATWHEYERGEFGQVLDQMIEQRRTRAAELRAEGQSLRQIAARNGVSLGQVQRDLAAGVSGDTPQPPVTVTGSDGKQYPATRPPTQEPAGTGEPAPGPPATPPNAAAGGPTPDDRPKPPKWDPAERKAHEAEVQRIKDIEAAHRYANTLVADVRARVLTVVEGYRLGERGLVTRQDIADLRRTIDLLEGELSDEE